eukprot:4326232-Amphidinium_carterae.1
MQYGADAARATSTATLGVANLYPFQAGERSVLLYDVEVPGITYCRTGEWTTLSGRYEEERCNPTCPITSLSLLAMFTATQLVQMPCEIETKMTKRAGILSGSILQVGDTVRHNNRPKALTKTQRRNRSYFELLLPSKRSGASFQPICQNN